MTIHKANNGKGVRVRKFFVCGIDSKIAPQFCAVIFRQGVLPPYGKIGKANFSYPRLGL